MLIGILSDTHDRIDALVIALHMLRGRNVEHYIHCGDVGGGQRVLDQLAGLPVTFIWGNNDWDVAALEDYAAGLGLSCGGRFVELTLGGKSFAVTHGDDGGLKKRILDGQQRRIRCIRTHVQERRDLLDPVDRACYLTLGNRDLADELLKIVADRVCR